VGVPVKDHVRAYPILIIASSNKEKPRKSLPRQDPRQVISREVKATMAKLTNRLTRLDLTICTPRSFIKPTLHKPPLKMASRLLCQPRPAAIRRKADSTKYCRDVASKPIPLAPPLTKESSSAKFKIASANTVGLHRGNC